MKSVYLAIPLPVIAAILFAFFLSSNTKTYQVSGRLVSEQGAALSGHGVVLLDEHDGQLAGGQTDTQGRFTLAYQVEPTSADPFGGADMPSEFKLGASYPNPFNPRTTVPFYAPEHTRAAITVYNILGRQILRTQADVSAGRHEILINLGAGLAQGQYLLRVQGEGFSVTQSMTFVSAGLAGGTPGISIRTGADGRDRVAGSVQHVQTGATYRLVIEQTALFSALEVQVPARTDHDAGTITVARRPDPPLSLQVSVDSDGIDRVGFAISARDTVAGLSWVALDYGAGSDTIRVQGTALDTTLTRSYGGLGGHFAYRVTASDGLGLELSRQGALDLTGLARVELTWRGYLFEEPLEGGEIHFSHKGINFDTTLVSNEEGRIQATLPRGNSYVLLHANPNINLPSVDGEEVSNISRIKLSSDFLPEQYSPSFWHGRDSTYIVSGKGVFAIGSSQASGTAPFRMNPPSDLGFYINLGADLSTLIETAENTYDATNTNSGGYLLEEMSRQTHRLRDASKGGFLAVPRTDIPWYIIHNWGDPNCASNWRFGDGICTEVGEGEFPVLPGLPINTTPPTGADGDSIAVVTKQYFEDFVDKKLSYLEHPKVGGMSYDVRVVSGWGDEVNQTYYEIGSFGNIRFRNNVEIFSHSVIARESYDIKGVPFTVNYSRAFIPPGVPGIFSNESTMDFAVTESSPIVWKSVRDEEREAFNAGYGVILNDFYYPKDELFRKIAFGFGPYAQNQYIPERDRPDRPSDSNADPYGSDNTGFNIQLHYYESDD